MENKKLSDVLPHNRKAGVQFGDWRFCCCWSPRQLWHQWHNHSKGKQVSFSCFFSFRSFLKQGGALWSRFLSSFCWVFQLRSWGWSHARFRGRHRKWSFCPQVHFPWKMAPRSWEIQQVMNEVAASMDPVWKLWFWQSLWKLCRVWAHLVGEAGEHIYGGGEQYTYLDLKVDDTILRHLVILKIHPL